MPSGSGGGECSKRPSAKPERLVAPLRIHVYVWVFMIALSVSPVLYMLVAPGGVDGANVRAPLFFVGLIQTALLIAQVRCSSEDLTYWEGLLAAAASVTTGSNLMSLLRSLPLLLAIVMLSVAFALDHDARTPIRDAKLRYATLIIWAHKYRLRR